MVNIRARPLLTPGKTRYQLYRRLGGPQGRSEQLRNISPPTGIRSPDRPAPSQSLYRLRYPAHNLPVGLRCKSTLALPFGIFLQNFYRILRSYFSCTRTFLRSFFAKFLGADYSRHVGTQSRRKYSACTSERTQSTAVINVRRLVTCRIIICVQCENHKKHLNTLCGHTA